MSGATGGATTSGEGGAAGERGGGSASSAAGSPPDRTASGGHHVLERRQLVPRPPEETFRFFADPGNLGRIVPRWVGFRLLEGAGDGMEEGTRLRYRLGPPGVPIPWTSLVTAWEPPGFFADEQVKGPYAYWRHEHRFREREGGTEVHDRILYGMPGGLAGRMAHRFLVRRVLRAIFDHRAWAVRRILGPPPP